MLPPIEFIYLLLASNVEQLEEGDFDDLFVAALLLLFPSPSLSLSFRFNISEFNEEACRTLFRFSQVQLGELVEAFEIPIHVSTNEGYKFTPMEALCVLCRRLAYPSRWSDLESLFGRPSSALCSVFLYLNDYLLERYKDILYFDKERLAPLLPIFSKSIKNAGAPLSNCWGFIDGTIRPCSRPIRDQKLFFNGHKRLHGLKFHSIVTPDGIISHVFGPVEGRRHDAAVLRLSGLQETLSDDRFSGYTLYGDPAYPVNKFLVSPYKSATLTPEEAEFNKRMSAVRIAVEWSFGRITNLWTFLEFKRSLKVLTINIDSSFFFFFFLD